MTRIICVTGTDTDVGKTIATAALVRLLDHVAPGRVAVDKPAQTGVTPDGIGDVDEVRRLSGVDRTSEGVRLLRPMAPRQAADREGAILPSLADHARRINSIDADIVVVEGSGGLLVELDSDGGTIADLALLLAAEGHEVHTLVVTRPGLGTLNHTLLTLEALAGRAVPVLGLVLGSWPQDPGAVEVDTRAHLSDPARTGTRLIGALPDGAGSWTPEDFRARAAAWFAPPEEWLVPGTAQPPAY